MQQFYEDIIRINPRAQVFTTVCDYYNVLLVYVFVLFLEMYYYVLLQFYYQWICQDILSILI